MGVAKPAKKEKTKNKYESCIWCVCMYVIIVINYVFQQRQVDIISYSDIGSKCQYIRFAIQIRRVCVNVTNSFVIYLVVPIMVFLSQSANNFNN